MENLEEIKYTIDVYEAEIKINEKEKKSIKPKTKNGSIINLFIEPKTSVSSKIYVIKNVHNTIVYIGQTSQKLSNRLRQGLNSKYYYQWNQKEIVTIICFNFEEKLDSAKLEAIEAELVFNIRAATGKWPLYQSEIHFRNHPNIPQSFAKKMFEELVK